MFQVLFIPHVFRFIIRQSLFFREGTNTLSLPGDNSSRGTMMPAGSIAMLDVDHHIHLIPSGRVLMLSIEHSAIKKVENERYEVSCILRLSAEGGSHQFEDVIRFSFAAARIPGQQMMTELTFVQNHIIKDVFDNGLSGELCSCDPSDPLAKESGVSLSSVVKTRMLASATLKEVLARHGALTDSVVFGR
jgi:hypothetical protein